MRKYMGMYNGNGMNVVTVTVGFDPNAWEGLGTDCIVSDGVTCFFGERG